MCVSALRLFHNIESWLKEKGDGRGPAAGKQAAAAGKQAAAGGKRKPAASGGGGKQKKLFS